MNKNLQMIKQVVIDMGGTIEEFMPERHCFYINIQGKRILLDRNISLVNKSFVSSRLTQCKDITFQILHAQKIPTPKTVAFYRKNFEVNEAEKALSSLHFPIILKDAKGSNSRGVFPFISNVKEALKIIKDKLPYYRSMVAQTMVFGKEFRVLVLGGRVIGALEMIPPYVVGDGVTSIKKLIKAKQTETDKRTEFNRKLDEILNDQHMKLRSVPAKDQVVFIKKNSCLAEGGETRDVTSIVNAEAKKLCVAAAKAVGKDLVGIDVICKDIAKKPTNKSFFILEINGMPDLSIHHTPTTGKSQNVVREIVKFMVKSAR